MSWLVALRRQLEAEGFYCEIAETWTLQGGSSQSLRVVYGVGAKRVRLSVTLDGRVYLQSGVPLDHPIWRAVEIARTAWRELDGLPAAVGL